MGYIGFALVNFPGGRSMNFTFTPAAITNSRFSPALFPSCAIAATGRSITTINTQKGVSHIRLAGPGPLGKRAGFALHRISPPLRPSVFRSGALPALQLLRSSGFKGQSILAVPENRGAIEEGRMLFLLLSSGRPYNRSRWTVAIIQLSAGRKIQRFAPAVAV